MKKIGRKTDGLSKDQKIAKLEAHITGERQPKEMMNLRFNIFDKLVSNKLFSEDSFEEVDFDKLANGIDKLFNCISKPMTEYNQKANSNIIQ